MPRRPLPVLPRLARLRKRDAADEIILACPRVCPRWELRAIQVLMKPQLRGQIEHVNGTQKWPRDAKGTIDRVWTSIAAEIGLEEMASPLHLDARGEFHAVATFSSRDENLARTLAVALSLALPDTWWVAGRLFVKNGKFFRRERGVKLNLVAASSVHLPRELRRAVRLTLIGSTPLR